MAVCKVGWGNQDGMRKGAGEESIGNWNKSISPSGCAIESGLRIDENRSTEVKRGKQKIRK
jgi:hypothetical protein